MGRNTSADRIKRGRILWNRREKEKLKVLSRRDMSKGKKQAQMAARRGQSREELKRQLAMDYWSKAGG